MGNKLKKPNTNSSNQTEKELSHHDEIMVDIYNLTSNPQFPHSDTSATTTSNSNPNRERPPPINSNLNTIQMQLDQKHHNRNQSGTISQLSHMRHTSHSKTISSLHASHKPHTPTNSVTMHSIFDSKLSNIEYDMTHSQRPSEKYRRSSSIIMKVEKLIKPTATQINEQITQRLIIEEMEQKYSLDLLLLGSQQSGKNIIFKQMEKAFLGEIEEKTMEFALESIRINIVKDIVDLCKYNNQLNNDYKYLNGLNHDIESDDVKQIRDTLIWHSNDADNKTEEKEEEDEEEEKYLDVRDTLKKMANANPNSNEIRQENKENKNVYKLSSMELEEICFRLATFDTQSLRLSRQLAIEIHALWRDKAMQNTFQQAKKLTIMDDNTKYFLDKVLQIVDEEYMTTFDDYVRVPRDYAKIGSGVLQKKFLIETKYGKYRFNVSQISSQRSDRRRWIRWLDNINVVVYVVNLSVYDTPTYEDYNKNCLDASMDLFEDICKQKTFNNTDFVVFFNKIEEFNDKIANVPFTIFQPNFDPLYANKSEHVKEWIMNEFIKIFRGKNRDEYNVKKGNIYFHEVNDSDTEQIGLLLQKVQTDVITSAMKRMGYVF